MNPSRFSPETVKAAAEWLTLSMDTAFNTDDANRLQQWRLANPEHEQAWQHIASMRASILQLNGRTAYQTLSRLHSPSRRSALKALAWFGVAAGGGYLVSNTETWQQQMANYSTGTGELKTFELPDGTQIAMNTRSAINVHFDGKQRLITLLHGEVLVTTGHLLGEQRILQLRTRHGDIQPIGTRFTVRSDEHHTKVAVIEGAVRIRSRQGISKMISAGVQTSFSASQVHPESPIASPADAWSKGLLFANSMPLSDFANELARYRTGFIVCDPAVAKMTISGVFPLKDTTQALEAIANSLPVRIVYRTRYWVNITAHTQA
jgi:transmembrane sensor